MPQDLIECSIFRGGRGIIIAGDDNGNLNQATLKKAARAADLGKNP